MRWSSFPVFSLLTAALAGCDAPTDASPAVVEGAAAERKTGPQWYATTGSVSMFGGVTYTIDRVDLDAFPCPDGVVADGCNVDEVDVTAAALDPAIVAPSPINGTVLHFGRPALVAGESVLQAREVWGQVIGPLLQSSLELQPDVALVRDSGIACVATPCPVYDEILLSSGVGTGSLAELDFSFAGATQAEIDAALAAAAGPDGLIVEGPAYEVVGPAGTAEGRLVFRFWTKAP